MFEVETAELGISFKVSVGFQFTETDLNYPLYLFILVSNGAAKKHCKICTENEKIHVLLLFSFVQANVM